MAASNATWIVPVSYTKERSGVRLLELPRELDELIASQRLQRLFIKSAAANSDSTSSGYKRTQRTLSPYAVLCTDTQTYQLRQVQSSNSVLVSRPKRAINAEQDIETLYSSNTAVSADGLSTFATCSSFLELNRLDSETIAAAKLYDAEQWIRELILEYDENADEYVSGDDVFMANDATNTGRRSKDELFSEIPFSQGECEDAWRSLCAFEFRAVAVAPSAETLLRAWKEIFLSFDLTKPIDSQEVRHVAHDIPGIPLEMIDSILLRIGFRPSQASSDIVPSRATDSERIQLDETATAVFVGEIYFATVLYFIKPSERHAEAFSLDSWQAQLPQSWRAIVTMDLLATLRHEKFKPLPTSSGAVREPLTGSNDESQTPNLLEVVNAGGEMTDTHPKIAKTGSDGAAVVAAKPGRNRNWHEKFKKARDAK